MNWLLECVFDKMIMIQIYKNTYLGLWGWQILLVEKWTL